MGPDGGSSRMVLTNAAGGYATLSVASPTLKADAATKGYVLNPDATINMGGNSITNLPAPTAASHAATKGYVDAQWQTAYGPAQSAIAAPMSSLVGNLQSAVQIAWQPWYVTGIATVTMRQTLVILPCADKVWTNSLIVRCAADDGTFWSMTQSGIVPLSATRSIVTQLTATAICSQSVFAVTYSANTLASGMTGYTTRVEYRITQ